MDMLKRILLLAALLLPMAVAHGEGRSTALINVSNMQVTYLDGTPYVAPFFDVTHTNNSASSTLIHGVQHVEFSDGSGVWSASRCDGNCQGNYPPVDNTVGAGGYANADNYGTIALARNATDLGFAQVRSDAAVTTPGETTLVTAGATYYFQFSAPADRLLLTLDARPYVDQFLAPESAPGSSATAFIQLIVRLTSQTTGDEVFVAQDPLLNGTFDLADDSAGDSFIFNPGVTSLSYDLGVLAAGERYELAIQHRAISQVLLAVPEPVGSTLYLAGLLVVIGAIRRRARSG